MANEQARALVAQLQARGLSQSAIGRAVGLDSGAISQIARDARGTGYGAAAVPRLAALVAETGRARNDIQARGIAQGIAGRQVGRPGARAQRVRQPTKRVGPKTASAPGKSLRGTGAGAGVAVDKLLATAEANGQRVSVRIEIATPDGGTRWITIDRLPAAVWAMLLAKQAPSDTMRDRLRHAIEELSDTGELGSEWEDVTGSFQINVEAIA